MSTLLKVAAILLLIALAPYAQAQNTVKGRILDAVTKEPIAGATVSCTHNGCTCGCATNAQGEFVLKTKDNCCAAFSVSYIGYNTQQVAINEVPSFISLIPATSAMQEVVISANRQAVKRSDAPVAISNINPKMLQDAKPATADQVLNKVSGVYMVNLGNEQHSMSIRQPMTTKSLFLYLEDGIPLRTTGLFNHNALLEVNMAAVKNIEVIKGPSSSLYGSEAIGGVVNFITAAPTAVPVLKFSAQGNHLGYQRADLQTSFSNGKWGVALNGYYAERNNGFIEYSDFNKSTFTARVDYNFSKKTVWSNSLTWLNYESDMSGTVDSAQFANRSFTSMQTFTYRNVAALRYRSVLNHTWNEKSKTSLSLVYRDNTIEQNPSYAIKNDRRKLFNGTWTGKKEVAHGEINNSSFNSYVAIAQHRQSLSWKNAVFIGGASVDISPATYSADYIRINVDTLTNKYVGYQKKDSTLTNYQNGINNYAGFANFEFNLLKDLRVVTSLRYDLFQYRLDNHLKQSAFSGAADTVNSFYAVSPKVGFTYNVSNRTGFYANYSQGFVPPQVTEMYRGVKVPNIKPAVFYNYEVGGWAEIIKNKLSTDVSIYRLNGTNEIVSVKLDDGSTENRNAGKTRHEGIELGVNATALKDVSLRFSGAYSQHRFVDFVEKGISYNGNAMNGAAKWMHNAEVWYKPSFIKGLRVGVEWQRLGAYYLDPANTTPYKGFHAFHVRAGYQWRGAEIWMNVLNATNNYYAFTASKSGSGYSYTPAEPRNINIGIAYDFGKLIKSK